MDPVVLEIYFSSLLTIRLKQNFVIDRNIRLVPTFFWNEIGVHASESIYWNPAYKGLLEPVRGISVEKSDLSNFLVKSISFLKNLNTNWIFRSITKLWIFLILKMLKKQISRITGSTIFFNKDLAQKMWKSSILRKSLLIASTRGSWKLLKNFDLHGWNMIFFLNSKIQIVNITQRKSFANGFSSKY